MSATAPVAIPPAPTPEANNPRRSDLLDRVRNHRPNTRTLDDDVGLKLKRPQTPRGIRCPQGTHEFRLQPGFGAIKNMDLKLSDT
jgi:hypothetical protein